MELVNHLYKAAILLGIFYLTYRFVLRKDTLFTYHRHFLLLGVASCFLLPLWEITQSVVVEIPQAPPTIIQDIPLEAQTFETQSQPTPVISWSLIEILFAIYVIGVAFFTFRFLLQTRSLYTILRGASIRTLNGYKLVTTDAPVAPFSFFNFVVYNPAKHESWELEAILKHEYIHIKQWHSIDILLANLLIILQWFNPLAWMYKNAITENLEFIADRLAQEQVPSRKQYQLALVKASSDLPAPRLANSFYQSFIKKRIIMLNKNQSKKYHAIKALLILPLLALFLYSFNVKTVTTYVEVPEEQQALVPLDLPSNTELTSREETVNLTKVDKSTEQSIEAQASPNLSNEAKQVVQPNDFEAVISKTTSEARLQEIKKELKAKYDITLNYSTSRNSAGEITSLSMSYSGNGKNGNYQVTDDTGIEEFTFYLTDDGRMGFYSEAQERRHMERELEMKERHAEMERRHEEMQERHEERRIEMEERMMERQEAMEARAEEREHMMRERAHARVEMAHTIHSDRDRARLAVVSETNGGTYEIVQGEHPGVIVVNGHSSDAVMIDKDTTDEELKHMKDELSKKGVTFNYRNVKRNSRGEIHAIKFTVKDSNGKSISNIKGDNEEPIDPIMISH